MVRNGLAVAMGLALAFTPGSPVSAAETVRYVVLVHGGTKAGQQVVTHDDDGVTRTDFIFKDNGRGPEGHEEYSLLPGGGFKSYHITGKTTFGSSVDERYDAADGKGRWVSAIDKGEATLVPGAFYSPLAGTPESMSVMLTALAASPDHSIPLLPSGRLNMRRIDTVPVRKGTNVEKATLVAITGLGFTPQFLWMNDGPKPRLFASIVPGYMQAIEEGWEANANALEARQKTAEQEVLRDMQKRLAHPLAGSLLIRNARVFDSGTATLGKPADVLVRDGRIVSIAVSGKKAAKADQMIDAGGRTLLPGLFDLHAHIDRWSGGLDIAAGVTSVRDMGNDNPTMQDMLREEREGTLLIPRIVPAGFIEGESKYSARMGFVIKNIDEAKKAVDWYAAHGYPQLKVYNSFPKDILKETVAYAHSKGMRVSGHVPAFLRAQDVVDDGFDEIQHINQVLLNFLVKPDTDTRTLDRFYLPAREVADLDFDSKPVQEFIAKLAKKQIDIDSTMTAFEFLKQRNGEPLAAFEGIEDHLPSDVVRNGRVAQLEIPDDATAQRYRKSVAKMVEFIGRMYKAGVPLIAGTDDVPGFALQRELQLYVDAGLTPAQVLQIATRNGARYSRVDKDLGSITPGKKSDLILVDGDPTKDIRALRNVATVLKGATLYYPQEIYRELGIKPFAEPLKPVAGH
ncbi:amidohydrolase family protein [Solilutibacter silvestris]|uniref:amidohydrolase family protein n=1 Tax=Solilutibacter silvestris TaxID=1645665 RepID=UPI003D34E423